MSSEKDISMLVPTINVREMSSSNLSEVQLAMNDEPIPDRKI